MKDKLLNCPFCGGKAVTDGQTTDYSVEFINIKCDVCECTTDDFQVPNPICKESISETERKVSAAWNKRV